ncbi:hypothetical protein KVR01_005395 [Diaporthe batatas]|uniref:uncharacterized protein n=1 Tax=Diaporthe batatas TaxID=748121 RepID=UPI001D0443E0|nr:uncharacterized protein KVR01_005395 [Diaporthe batatas]KAG8165120.1 hypothetical protein KVR01_005395 [Diaporthe batatas]
MASLSESPDEGSPPGSVRIARDPQDGAVPFERPAYMDSASSATQDSTPSIKNDPMLPNTQSIHSKDPGHWADRDTVDPALIRFTVDEPHTLTPPTPSTPPTPDEPNLPGFYERLGQDQSPAPFHRWMRTLRRRGLSRRPPPTNDDDPVPRPFSASGLSEKLRGVSHHRHSSSGSSFGFVETVKTASASLASGSIFARSRCNSMRSSRSKTHTDLSSRASMSGNRCSEDTTGLDKPQVVDKATVERSLQRRRILEELISTEESYIGDVRFLMNAYVTILVSLPTMPLGLRSSINRNLTDIIELHEEILGELHRAVPYSEYTQLSLRPDPKSHVHGHSRIRSLDVVPEDNRSMSWLETVPGMVAEPSVVADVAQIFTKKMNRLFVYEEYGAKYEMMMKDISSAHRTMPQWELYQKGLETLASSLGPASKHGVKSKKSLTIGDLLVKPMQRLCKYPLLFSELLKYTPVADSPYAHMEIENSLVRLREATSQVNRATDNARVKDVLEKTWLLQDRLVFPDSELDAASKTRIRSFGHIELCGTLHACWQTKDGIHGQYMVALLYKNWFCLASASRVDQIYTLQACVPTNTIKIEPVDNGRGLQCHTAPFSWKIVFECDCQLYEMMLTACTPKEEHEWRSHLEIGSAVESQDLAGPELYGSLFLNMKSLSTVFGKQGTVARRLSIHRATTVGPKTPLCHVVVRNTSVEKEAATSSNATISRTQSLLASKGRIPVLAPTRGDRARLEALLSDVWTRDALPFPGMTTRARNEHIIRTSAQSMIRKLSVTSITSTFTKRSASFASITRNSDDGSGGEETVAPVRSGRNETPIIRIPIDEQNNNARLSVIDDESDKTTPSTLRAFGEPPSTTTGTGSPRRRTRIAKSPSAWQLGELALAEIPSASAALRAKSTNSPRLKRQGSMLSRRSVCSAFDKNDSFGKDTKKRRAYEHSEPPSSSRGSTPSPRKHLASARWSKVDVLRGRGAVSQGLRGFFR